MNSGRWLLVGGLAAVIAFLYDCKKPEETSLPVKQPIGISQDLIKEPIGISQDSESATRSTKELSSIVNTQYVNLDGYATIVCEKPVRLIEHENGFIIQAAAPAQREWEKAESRLGTKEGYKELKLDFFDGELEAIVYYDPTVVAPEGYEDKHTYHFNFVK